MNIKRIALVLALVLLTVGGGIGYTYHAERTPEHALAELQAGIKSRDYNKVKQYADLGALIETTYDESTKIMADNIESLSKTYPQDWFFRHDTAFMQNYIAARRGDDLVFIQRTLDFYMDQQATPLSRVEGQAKWVSDEMTKFEDLFPYGHGEKSVFLIERFMKLKVEEAVAIRWHMGGFDDAARGGCFAISEAYDKYPLAVKLHIADLQATYLMEHRTSNMR